MGQQQDFIKPGFKFNDLTVLEKSHSTKAGVWWVCQCKCGKTCKITASRLNGNNKKTTVGCGCTQYDKAKKGTKNISGTFFGSIRHHAKFRGKHFDLTIEYLQELWEKQGGKCAISGVLLEYKLGKKYYGQTMSLDRIDSCKGYIEGNVQWVHKQVNFMKLEMSKEELIKWCKIIVENNKEDCL